MADWKKSKTFCSSCHRWITNQGHKSCAYGTKGSLVFVDLEKMLSRCNKCNDIWLLEKSVMYCSCGHIQRTEYSDTDLYLDIGDEIIEDYGDLVYIRRRSGVVSVGYRTYHNQSYA